ncbi:MAG TPA: hypothetical protein DCY91_22985 [Cyanobacteria bacterium UBA11370]|nr:hypothetical protein [Cyanobacteria bacterium UBA11370]HBY78029.1 hypothetical protein [Cyanobacteria bacterium UBA11148]
MRRLLLFVTTSFLVRFWLWVPMRFFLLRVFGLYIGNLVFHLLGGILFVYCVERFFILFQDDDGRGLLGVFIPEWVQIPVTIFFCKITRPLRKQWFIFKHGYPP